jgi:hypothetical protein
VLIEGRPTVEVAGNRLRELGAGSFAGLVTGGRRSVGPDVQLAISRGCSSSAPRLALIDRSRAAAWRKMSQQA